MTELDDDLLTAASAPPTPLPPRPRPSLAPPFGWGSLPAPETDPESLPAGEGSLPGLDPSPGDPSPSATDWPSGGDDEWTEDTGISSPESSADSPRVSSLVSKAQLRRTAEQAVLIGGGMAHTVAAKSEEAKAVGLYLADEDDAKAIGHPLADIMHRRGDMVGGKLSPDANSALQAFLGLAGYLTKQVTKTAAIRDAQTSAAQGQAL